MIKKFIHPSEQSLEEQSELLHKLWTILNHFFTSRFREELIDRLDRRQYQLICYSVRNPQGLLEDYLFEQEQRHLFEDLSPLFPEGTNNQED